MNKNRLNVDTCTDTVSRGVFEQVMRERDIAIEQLHELGYELGQKIEPLEVEAAKLQHAYNKDFEDCRQAVLDLINADWEYEGLEVPVNSLLPVTQNPETVTEFADRCRECGAKYGKLLEQKSGKYTADELRVFADGISLSLCSKKSAQHWSYNEKTAEQIRWLECLHSKVKADIADMNCGARMESEK